MFDKITQADKPENSVPSISGAGKIEHQQTNQEKARTDKKTQVILPKHNKCKISSKSITDLSVKYAVKKL